LKPKGWKQEINIGKKNDREFTDISDAKLIHLLTDNLQLTKIEVIFTKESYTKKASALEFD